MSELIGRVFRSYEILQELGRGGMAVVYLARQQSMDRLVAIKVIARGYSDDPDFRARFDREARTIARLEHPHILPVIDYGEEDFGSFLVMRYVEGGTLERRLADGPLRLSAARDLLARIASALDYAHAKGVIHRDLKPGNILLDEVDNPYLTDFGIAKILQSAQQLTHTGAAVGTPAYMAPEQWKADPIGPFTDQYSLGVVLYQMVTGNLPFQADTTFGFMHKHIYEAPEPPGEILADLPSAAEAVILRALAKAPQERYPSVREMSDAFTEALAGGITPPAPVDVVAAVRDPADQQTLLDTPASIALGRAEPGGAEGWSNSRGLIVTTALLTVIVLAALALLTGGFGLLGRATPTVTSSPTTAVADDPTADSAAALPTPSATPTPTSSPTATATATRTATPDRAATADAVDFATLRQVMRDLTATANAALIDQATRQAAETGTVMAASYTATPGPTLTPSPTRTPPAVSASPRPTRTVTAVSTATATALPLVSCPGLLASRLAPGLLGQVSADDPRPVNVRSAPGLAATRLDSFPVNTRFRVLEGPTCADEYPWFRVERLADGRTGWIAESGEGVYYLEPVDPEAEVERCPGVLPPRLAIGMTAAIDTPDGLPLHAEPGDDRPVTTLLANRLRLTVLEGPVCQAGLIWWRVRAPEDRVGWISEADADRYFVEPVS